MIQQQEARLKPIKVMSGTPPGSGTISAFCFNGLAERFLVVLRCFF